MNEPEQQLQNVIKALDFLLDMQQCATRVECAHDLVRWTNNAETIKSLYEKEIEMREIVASARSALLAAAVTASLD